MADHTGAPGVEPTASTVPGRVGDELYTRVGGDAAIRAAVALFYQRVIRDPVLAGYFAGVDMDRLVAHQRAFVAASLGGPRWFAGRSLREAHARLRVDDAAFDAMMDSLILALVDVGVDHDTACEVRETLEQFRTVVVSAR